jgi:hypothetical protein
VTQFHEPGGEDVATAHVLEAPLLPQEVISRYWDKDARNFDWQGLLNYRSWSSSEEALIRAAVGIWNGSGDCTLGMLITRLKDDDYRRVLEAMALRRGILMGEPPG